MLLILKSLGVKIYGTYSKPNQYCSSFNLYKAVLLVISIWGNERQLNLKRFWLWNMFSLTQSKKSRKHKRRFASVNMSYNKPREFVNTDKVCSAYPVYDLVACLQSRQAHDVNTTSMQRHDVASTLRRRCIYAQRRKYNVASTSMQRLDVASTLRRRCIYVMCPLGFVTEKSFYPYFAILAVLSSYRIPECIHCKFQSRFRGRKFSFVETKMTDKHTWFYFHLVHWNLFIRWFIKRQFWI